MNIMNHQEPTDPAWELLKKARKVEPSLFFVRNVVREVRMLPTIPVGIWGRVRAAFRQRGFLTASAACAVVTISLVLFMNRDQSVANSTSAPVAINLEDQSNAFDPASEMAAVEYLGQLMAVADPGQLDETALADLFF
jgi:hypothetical protein